MNRRSFLSGVAVTPFMPLPVISGEVGKREVHGTWVCNTKFCVEQMKVVPRDDGIAEFHNLLTSTVTDDIDFVKRFAHADENSEHAIFLPFSAWPLWCCEQTLSGLRGRDSGADIIRVHEAAFGVYDDWYRKRYDAKRYGMWMRGMITFRNNA